MPERFRVFAQLRERIRFRHYSIRTGEAYVGWIRRFTLFHGGRHPREIELAEVAAVPARLDGQYHSAIWLPHALAHQYPAHAAGIGHADVRTTQIYTHVIERGGRGVKSPLGGVLAGIRPPSA